MFGFARGFNGWAAAHLGWSRQTIRKFADYFGIDASVLAANF